MAERVKLMKEMLEIGQSFGFKGTELQQYVEQQVKAAENQAHDERAARRAQEKEDEEVKRTRKSSGRKNKSMRKKLNDCDWNLKSSICR